MQTNVDHGRLARARAKFEPVAQVLNRVAKDIEKDHGGSALLVQRGTMQQTAQNTYTVRYSIQHPDDARFALTFVVTGEDADLLLLQAHQRAGPRDMRANPGQVDQRVYRLEKIEDIKQAVQEKIYGHLRARTAQH